MDQIGKYRLEAEIGRGGFGRVYRAFDPTVGRRVAIKVLLAEGDQDVLTRFRNEANATGKLHHKNIVTIHDYGEFQGTPYLVMEFLEGEDLQQIIAGRRRLTVLEKVSIMSEVAEGLHHAHVKGIVHRDVKPANMMLLAEGHVKVMDFGIARLVRERATRLTQTGNLIGTISHMAPEQFQGSDVDQLCDIFAYGLVYYELLTGKHPFKGGDPATTIYNITSRDPEPISPSVPECPAALEQIVLRALHKDRDMRYQSLEDLLVDVAPIRLHLQSEAAQSLVRQAEDSFTEKRVEDAQRFVREALQLDPNNPSARRLREAIQRASQVRVVKERSSQLVAAGVQELSAGNYPKAINRFEAALKIDTENTDAFRLLEEAKAAGQRSQRVAALLAKARRQFEEQDLTNALLDAKECLQLAPGHEEASMLIAAIQKEIDRRDRARRLQDSLLSIESLVRAGSFDEATARLGDLEKAYPESEELRQMVMSVHFAREEHNRRQKLATVIATARRFLAERRWQDAIDSLEELVRQFPSDREIPALLDYAREALRIEENTERVDRLVREAEALIERDEFDRAENHIASSLRAYPNQPSLEALRERIRDGRRGYERRLAVEKARRRSEQLLARKHFKEAIDELDRAISSENAVELLELRYRAEEELREHERAEVAERTRAQRLAAALQAALERSVHSEFDQALQILERAVHENGSDVSLLELRSRIEKERQEHLRREAIAKVAAEARKQEEAGEFEAAIATLERAAQTFPGDLSLRSLLSQALDARRSAIERLLDSADGLLKSHQFEDAFAALQWGLDKYPGNSQLTSALDEARRTKADFDRNRAIRIAQERVDQLRSEGRLEDAIRALKQALVKLPGEPVLLETLASIQAHLDEQERMRVAVSETQALLEAGKLEEAISKLRQYEREFPGAAEILTLISGVTGTLEAKTREEEIDRTIREAQIRLREAKPAEAVAALEAVLRKYPDHEELRTLLDTSLRAAAELRERQAIQDILQEARSLEEQGRFTEAVRVLDRGMDRYPDGHGLREAKSDAQRREKSAAIAQIVDEAKAHVAKDQFGPAIDILQRGLARFPEETKLTGLLQSTRLAGADHQRRIAVTGALKQAEAALSKRRPDEALSAADAALRQFPGEPDLLRIKERAEAERAKLELAQKRKKDLEQLRGLAKSARSASEQSRLDEIWAQVSALLGSYSDASYADDADIKGAASAVRREIDARASRLGPPRQPAIEKDALEFAPPSVRSAEEIAPPARVTRPYRTYIAFGVVGASVLATALFFGRREAPAPVPPPKSEPSPRPVPQPARIVHFSASRTVINTGQTTQLCYGVQNAKSLRLEPEVTPVTVSANNCVDVAPVSSAEYKLIAAGEDGTETVESVRISVEGSPSTIGTLLVQTQVDGVAVMIDGRKYTRTTERGELRIPLDAKEYQVAVEKEGFRSPPPQRVRLDKDALKRVQFRLEKLPPVVVPPGRPVDPPVAKPIPLDPPPDPRTTETRAWNQIQNSRDPSAFEQYLRTYPNGQYVATARQRIEQLDWEAVRGKRDAAELQAFLSKHASSPHRDEALKIIEQIEWERLNRSDLSALRTHLRRFPNSSQAQAEISKLEAVQREATEAQSIIQVLNRFARAYESKDAAEINRIWPGIPGKLMTSIRNAFRDAQSITVQMRPLEKPQINGDTAVVKCERTTVTTFRPKEVKPTTDSVTVRLQRSGSSWVILALE